MVAKASRELLFKSMEDGVPDVVMHPLERGDHLPIRHLTALVEEYLQMGAYLCLYARRSSEFDKRHRSCVHLDRLTSQPSEIVRSIRCRNGDRVIGKNLRDDLDFPVLIPVIRFVEQPDRVLIERIPSAIWGKVDDDLAHGVISQMLDSFGVHLDARAIRPDGKRGVLFLLRRHVRGMELGQREDDVVETVPEALESVPDDKGEFVRKWLQHLCLKYEAPIAIGLLKDSIAIARPVTDKCFDVLNMELCPGEFTPVTE